MKYLASLLVWFLLVLVNLVGFLVALLATPFFPDYGDRVFKAQNKAAAAIFGFTGQSGVSRECGRSNCRLCKLLCKILSVLLEPNHCEKEAR